MRLLRVVVAFSLLWLSIWPQSRPYEPPPIQSKGTPEVSWSELATRKRNVEAFYEWASQLPPPKPAVKAQQPRAEVSYEPGSIESIVCSVFAGNCAKALSVARCESGLNPSAYNRSGASGLFQVMMPLHSDLFNRPEDVFDPLENSRAAFTLSKGGTNWSAWECKG